MTKNKNAVLIPKSNIPSPASAAPIIRHSRAAARPEEPRVVIELTEYSVASAGELKALRWT